MQILYQESEGEPTVLPHENLCIRPFLSSILKENDRAGVGEESDFPVSSPSEGTFTEATLLYH